MPKSFREDWNSYWTTDPSTEPPRRYDGKESSFLIKIRKKKKKKKITSAGVVQFDVEDYCEEIILDHCIVTSIWTVYQNTSRTDSCTEDSNIQQL